MPIDSIGPRQPGMSPEPEGEQPDLSVRQGVEGAQGPKAAGEAAVEAIPKLAVKTGEEAIMPKNWEPAGKRLGDAKLQGVLVRDHLQMTNEKMMEIGSKLPRTGAEAGAWEAKFRGEAGQAAQLRHKAASGIELQDNLQFTNPTERKNDEAMDKDHKHQVSIGLQAQGKVQFAAEKVIDFGGKLDKDLLVQERLRHAGVAVSQLSEKLPGEIMGKFDKDLLARDKDLLVRDKVKLANESAITLSRSKGQVSGGEAGVWEAKLQGAGSATAGLDGIRGHKDAAAEIDGVKGHKSAGVHKAPILIESNAPGAQLDKDHKAFAVSEKLGMAQSQNIWGERHVHQGDLEIQEKVDLSGNILTDAPAIETRKVDLSEDLRIVEAKPPDVKG